MSRYLWAALASAVAIASAGAADATVMVFQGQGVITRFRTSVITVPNVQVGDAATVSFLYDPARCIIISGACYGGDSAPGPGTGNPYYDVHVTVDGWTTTITGETYDTLAPGAYHVEDGLNFINVAVPTPAGADLLTPLDGSSGGAFVEQEINEYSFNIAFRSFYLHDAAVPEPATWATLILGLFGLGAAVRHRQRSNHPPAAAG